MGTWTLPGILSNPSFFREFEAPDKRGMREDVRRPAGTFHSRGRHLFLILSAPATQLEAEPGVPIACRSFFVVSTDSSVLVDRHRLSMPPVLDRALLGAIWLTAFVGAVLTYRVYSGFVFEDSYITYRYALNLAQGRGFTFTPGERVFGTTTPLYTLLLAGGGVCGADIPSMGSLMHAAMTGVVAVLGGLILRRFGAPIAAVLFAALAVTGFADLPSFWGMETPLFLALILGSMLAVFHRRDTTAGVLVALAFLTRYDAALFAILLFAILTVRDKRVPWKPGGVALVLVIPWLVFAWIYFGSFLPNTLQAKLGESSVPRFIYSSLLQHVETAWDAPLCILGSGEDARVQEAGLTVAVVLGGWIVIYRRFLREPLLPLLLVYPAALWIAYALIGPPIGFNWYLVPALYALLMLALLGWSPVFGRLPATTLRALLVVGAVLLALARYEPTASERLDRLTGSMWYVGRVEAYEELSDWVLENRLEDLTYMALEPGYFTYRTGSPAIDAAGLVTKGVYFHGPRARRTTQEDLIRIRQPDLILGSVTNTPDGYICVRSAFPDHLLLMEQGKLADRSERLTRHFESLVDAGHDRSQLRHPFHLNVSPTRVPAWRALGGTLEGARIQNTLTVGGKPIRDLHILDVQPRTGSETPEFLIDFDRIEFRFAGTHPAFTLAQLVVDGQIMFSLGGMAVDGTREFETVSWPVHAWRGHGARVRIIQAARAPNWAAADHFVSLEDQERLVIEDFETSGLYESRWSAKFGTDRTRLKSLVGEYGLSILTSDHAATSYGIEGASELVSRPFEIERDRMSFIVLDFGPSTTELLIDGAVVHSHDGTATHRLSPVTWDVTDSIGAQAVLRVKDREPSAGEWTGIDEIVQYDCNHRSRKN